MTMCGWCRKPITDGEGYELGLPNNEGVVNFCNFDCLKNKIIKDSDDVYIPI